MRRVSQIMQLRARAQRLEGQRKHKAATKVVARLLPLITRQLKAEIRQDRRKRA